MYSKAQFFIPRSVQSDISDFPASDLAAGEVAVTYLSSSDKLATYKVDDATDVSDFSDLTANMHNKFQVMWRKHNTSDVILTTPELSLADLIDVKVMASDVGTAQVTTITPTVAGTGVVGDIYSLTLVDSTPGTAKLKKWNFETQNTSGTDFAVSDLLDQWTSDINAMSDITNVQAADNTSDFTLTGQTKYNHFRVAVDGEGTATIVYTTNLKPPTGAYEQMVQMEKDMKSHGEGITNSIWFPRPWTSELSDTGYDLGVFEFKLNKPAKHGMNATNVEDYTLYIAEPEDIDLIDMLVEVFK